MARAGSRVIPRNALYPVSRSPLDAAALIYLLECRTDVTKRVRRSYLLIEICGETSDAGEAAACAFGDWHRVSVAVYIESGMLLAKSLILGILALHRQLQTDLC